MLGQQTESAENREQSQEEGGKRGPVGKSIPYVAAFVAGFLLGSRRGESGETGGEMAEGGMTEGEMVEGEMAEGEMAGEETVGGEEEAGRLREVAREIRSRAMPGSTDAGGATEQPSSMGSVAGEQEREREREQGETESGMADSETGAAEAEIPDEVKALEAPTTHGMPMFGLGTYQMKEYDECFESVRQALRMGYRHIDTAEGYHNEEAVGDAIAESEVDREELFVATKVGPEDLDYDHVLTAAEESLDRLGLEYVDLLYVHWPTGEYEATDTLDAFAELRKEGLIEEIGVSNFTVELLEEAVEISEEPIFANQVEMHPLLAQTELQQFCAQDDVDVELVAYSPIARGDVEDVDELQEIAQKHDATPAQVSLAWLRKKEVTAIPKATTEHHLRENWLSLVVELDDEDVDRIDDIEQETRLVDPDQAPWNQ